MLVNRVCGLLCSETLKEVSLLFYMEREVNLVSVVVLGRIVNNVWTATPLNDLHNLKNPAEVQRLPEEHPGKDDLVQRGRTKGQLGLPRGKHAMAFEKIVHKDLCQSHEQLWKICDILHSLGMPCSKSLLISPGY